MKHSTISLAAVGLFSLLAAGCSGTQTAERPNDLKGDKAMMMSMDDSAHLKQRLNQGRFTTLANPH